MNPGMVCEHVCNMNLYVAGGVPLISGLCDPEQWRQEISAMFTLKEEEKKYLWLEICCSLLKDLHGVPLKT